MADNTRMSSEKPPREKRKAALGVSFEHGSNGAVMVYIGQEELVLAYLPDTYAVDAKAATALAVAYKGQKVKKPLTARQSKSILDRILAHQRNPVVIGVTPLADVLRMLEEIPIRKSQTIKP